MPLVYKTESRRFNQDMESDVAEKAHRTNIEKLLEEFGEGRREEIRYVYQNVKSENENTAKIRDFAPIFIYRAVRDALRVKSE